MKYSDGAMDIILTINLYLLKFIKNNLLHFLHLILIKVILKSNESRIND